MKATVDRRLRGVQTDLQFILDSGLLYRRATNGAFPIHILSKGAAIIRSKGVKQKLEFARQRRELYLPYSPALTALSQPGWELPPLGLLLRLGASESYRAAGNDIVRYREIYARNQFERGYQSARPVTEAARQRYGIRSEAPGCDMPIPRCIANRPVAGDAIGTEV
ncbi:hypothetical protein Vafri_16035, partial [Volvox africanus]